MKEGFFVIDADGHVGDWEPQLRPYVSPKFRNRPLLAPAGVADKSVNKKLERFSNTGVAPQGNKVHSDPRIQLEDMDVEGIDIMVLYGTGALGMTYLRERELSVDLHRAYNDWLADFRRHNPRRLQGIAALPMIEPEAAARELERCVNQLGFIGGMAHTWIHNHDLSERYYDELYACAQELDVPISFHATGSDVPYRRFDSFLAEHTVGHIQEQMVAAMLVIYGGILDKFPRLRVAFLEGTCGWVPLMADKMDEEWELRAHEAPLLSRKPSDHFKGGRMYFGTEPEEWMMPKVNEYLGTDRQLLYASDYIHWDGAWPETTNMIVTRTDLSADNKRNLLGENAIRLYPSLRKVKTELSK